MSNHGAVSRFGQNLRLMLLAISIGLVAGPAAAATCHVPKDYKTIQAAVNAAKPGDTIVIAPGEYPERITFKPNGGGKAEKPLTIQSEIRHEAVMHGFDTTNADYLIIDGLTIRSPKFDGVFIGSDHVQVVSCLFEGIPGSAVRATSPHSEIVVRGNRVYRCQRGFMVKGKNWLVEDNTVERLVFTNGETDYIDFFGEGHIMRRNNFFGTFEKEIEKRHVDGFQTHGEGAKDCIIEDNFIADCHQGILLEASKPGGVRDVIIRHNVIYNCWSWGILLKKNSEALIENNLIYNSHIHGIGVRRDTKKVEDVGSKAVARNNIIVNARTFIWRDQASTLQSDYNLGFRIRDLKGRRDHDRIADPLFTDPPDDFTLRPGSPALNAAEDGGHLGPRLIWPGNGRKKLRE